MYNVLKPISLFIFLIIHYSSEVQDTLRIVFGYNFFLEYVRAYVLLHDMVYQLISRI